MLELFRVVSLTTWDHLYTKVYMHLNPNQHPSDISRSILYAFFHKYIKLSRGYSLSCCLLNHSLSISLILTQFLQCIIYNYTVFTKQPSHSCRQFCNSNLCTLFYTSFKSTNGQTSCCIKHAVIAQVTYYY